MLLILAVPMAACAQPSGQLVSWGLYVIPYIEPQTRFKDVSCGDGFTLAVTEQGTVIGWGNNSYGQCLTPADLNHVVTVAAGGSGGFGVALKDDGVVVAWGGRGASMRTVPAGLVDVIAFPPDLAEVVKIAVGPRGAIAIKRDGGLVSWGSQQYPFPERLDNVVDIAAGEFHRLALNQDGTVVQWPESSLSVPPPPAGLFDVVAIASGFSHCLALKKDGTVIGWGQSVVPSGLADVIVIAAGGNSSLALKDDGTVTAWGTGAGARQLPAGLDDVMTIAVSDGHGFAQRRDGSIVHWGSTFGRSADPTTPSFFKDAVALAAGATEGFAIRTPLRIAKLETLDTPNIHFRTFTGREYIKEATSDLADDSWMPVSDGRVPGTGDMVIVVDDVGAAVDRRFYRLREVP